jgi:trehalose 6-phosphate phosphatase
MRYFLSRACRSVATRLAAEKTLCAFDYDGTLAPIAAHPEQARMRATTRRLLTKLTALYPCAVISGRAKRDLLERLAGTGVTRAIGNHGADAGSPPREAPPEVEKWATELAPILAALDGVWVENKGRSLAVHYRQSVHKSEARRSILAAVRKLRQARVFGGKQVVNIVPAGAPNKGTALMIERDRVGGNSVLYVGDDDNDEDAFALAVDVVAVRIGRKPTSRARYYLRDQPEIDRLLELLIGLRSGAERVRAAADRRARLSRP